MAPASAPRSTNAGAACLQIAPNANKARGIVRAAAYIANINDACVGTDSTGTRYCGLTIPTMEKPVATRTLIAVTTEASRIAFIVVILFHPFHRDSGNDTFKSHLLEDGARRFRAAER